MGKRTKNLRIGLELAVILLIVLVGTSVRIHDVKINESNDTKIDKNIIKNNNQDKNFSCYKEYVLPVCLNLPQVRASLIYPELAKQIGLEGLVNINLLIGTEGNIIMIGNITGPEILCDEVKDKVIKLKFTPGLINNYPVNVWVNIPIRFKLGNTPHSEFRFIEKKQSYKSLE